MLKNIFLFFQYAFHEKLIRGRKNEKLFSPIFLIQYYLCVIHVAIVHNICTARAQPPSDLIILNILILLIFLTMFLFISLYAIIEKY